MTMCKQTPPAGAGSGHALSSPGLFPACPGEGKGPRGSESQRHRTLDSPGLTDGKGQETSSLLGAKRLQRSLAPTVFRFLKMDGAALGEHPSFPHVPGCSSLLPLTRSPSNSPFHLHT